MSRRRSRMLTTRNLILLLVLGCLGFVLFAFTIVGLVGEALVVLSLVALFLRAAAATVRHVRRDIVPAHARRRGAHHRNRVEDRSRGRRPSR